ncbi:hypothetical protein EYF80_007202 [Liparis tanakae]|uniref:Uncharacterized protein n=1 Tax=Liparis tanakae TaxID=230148 RepID=A0A4Z2IYR2_9TELE|nr:hypothetical protein EYF80_007202 [Liparis tanakae]
MAPVCPSSVLLRLLSTPVHPLLSPPCVDQRILNVQTVQEPHLEERASGRSVYFSLACGHRLAHYN